MAKNKYDYLLDEKEESPKQDTSMPKNKYDYLLEGNEKPKIEGVRGSNYLKNSNQADSEGRISKIAGGSFAAGYAGAPGNTENLLNFPSRFLADIQEKAGVPLSEAQIEAIETQYLPTAQMLYDKGGYPAVENWIERYISAGASGAGGGAFFGQFGGIPGAAAGSVVGGGLGIISEIAKDLGLPEETAEALMFGLSVAFGGQGAKSRNPRAPKKTPESLLEGTRNQLGQGGPPPPDVPPGAPKFGLEIPIIEGEGTSLQGRVSPERIPPEGRLHKSDIEIIGQGTKSPTAFPPEAEIGTSAAKTLQKGLDEWRANNKENYQAARSETSNYRGDAHLSMEEAVKLKERLSKSKSLSAPQKELLRRVEDILSLDDPNVKPTAEILRETADSIASSIKYEEPYLGAKEQAKALVRALNEDAIRIVEENGGDTSLLRKADKEYAIGANKYFNDSIEPFLNKKISNPEKLFKDSTNPETYRNLKTALSDTPEGNSLLKTIAMEFSESKMGDFVENPRKIGSREYRKAISEIEGLLGKEVAEKINKSMMNRRNFPERVTEASRDVSSVGKYLGLEEGTVSKMLDSVDGIRDLSSRLNRSERGRQMKENLFHKKIKSIGKKNLVDEPITGKNLYEQFRKENNFEILKELIGEENAHEFLQQNKKIGNKEIRKENYRTYFKKIADYKIIHLLLF